MEFQNEDNQNEDNQNKRDIQNPDNRGNQNYSGQKKNNRFLKGTLTGILAMVLVVFIAFTFLYNSGNIYFGYDGIIYVQNSKKGDGDGEGIGSSVSNKLDLLEKTLGSFYFDNADETVAENNIYKAYVASYGDKYTTYYTGEEYKDITQSTSGTYCGIGAVVSKNEDGTIKVVQPYENCPAFNAGIRAGDSITKVGGISVLDRDLTTVVSEMKGEEGTTVKIEVMRDGFTGPKEFEVIRQEIEVPTVSSKMMDGNIGFITITEFDEVTEHQFKNSYDELKAQGMKGLIVDIRSNPGGLLTTVVNMLDGLLPDGLIVYTEDKDGNRQEYKGKNQEQTDIPMVVLVNEDSASASEIFAGAIQDYGIGTIVGTQTFGKGIVQVLRPLTDGSAIKLTVAKYFTPKGQDIHGKGVTPDVKVEIASGKSYLMIPVEEDTQFQKGIEVLKDKIAGK